ncbi:carboxypeptidase A4 [Penaeus vannamei]|uniref:carboxypeptidase A4 n=1 Tax=Penaeus vannamei TaxID=6689 RepID=UPI00387F87D5
MRRLLLAPWLLLLLATAGGAEGGASGDGDYPDGSLDDGAPADYPDGSLDDGAPATVDYPDVSVPVISTSISEIQELVAEGLLVPVSPFEAGWGEALVNPEDLDAVLERLEELGIKFEYSEINVVTQMREEDVPCWEWTCPRPKWNSFMTLQEIKFFMEDAANSDPRVTFRSIKETINDRELYLVHVAPCRRQGPDPSDDSPPEPLPPNPPPNPGLRQPWAVWIQAGLGANDWMTTAVALHLLRKLMDDCQASHGMHFYIMVVGNPDGYHNSLLGQMTWTKNLHSFAGHCMGVCLPFNFPYYFNYGTMGSLCSPFYRGPSPMSEVETRAIVETLEQINNKHKLVMLLDLQQPGQSIVLPFSWNHINPEDYEAMRSLASTYTEAIRLNHNVYYDVNHNGYAMGGTLTEYAKYLLGIKYSYKIFLSIDVRYLFQPHPMRTLVPQVWTGLTAMLRELQKERVQEARKALSALPKGQDE